MPKKSGIALILIGAVLIVSALLLFGYNQHEDRMAGQEAELVLDDLRSAIPQPTDLPEPEQTLPQELPVVNIDGYDYIGYISIPDLELELPVMSEWDYTRLEIAPCRHFGSSRTDDLVIAAHNYKSHFRYLSRLEPGAQIRFTDMDGIENEYSLIKLETLAADAVDAVQNSGYDLVLYTCTPGGVTRTVAFCDRTAEGILGEGYE